jgi:hypothetical protein
MIMESVTPMSPFIPRRHGTTMQTLMDIEQAELLLFVAERLRSQGAPLPEPREFSEEQLRAWLDEDELAMARFRAGS